jgi:uncharacterized protein YcgI (DUF1989 family)
MKIKIRISATKTIEQDTVNIHSCFTTAHAPHTNAAIILKIKLPYATECDF